MVFYVDGGNATAREIRTVVRDARDSNKIVFFIEAVTNKSSRVLAMLDATARIISEAAVSNFRIWVSAGRRLQ